MTKRLILFVASVMLFTGVFTNNPQVAVAASPETTPMENEQIVPQEDQEIVPEDKQQVAPVEKIKATLYASDIVNVSWTELNGVSGYIIYEKQDGKFVQIRTVRSSETSQIKIKNVDKGVYHNYAIRSYLNDGKETFYSDRTEATKIYVPNVMTKRTKGFKNTTAFKMIKTAESKIGCRYVSGAQGPSQFDCSGYVYYISKKADVSPRKISRSSSASMWNSLREHSIGTKKLSKAQPGDIVFLSSSPNSRISHVAFYYGDDKYIHATSPGVGVAVTPTRHYGYVQGIVRLPNM